MTRYLDVLRGFALRLIGTSEVIPALVDLKNDDRGTRYNAEYALWEIWSHSGDAAVDAMLLDGKNLLKNEGVSTSCAFHDSN